MPAAMSYEAKSVCMAEATQSLTREAILSAEHTTFSININLKKRYVLKSDWSTINEITTG